jgi:hypothetical protein
MVDAKEIFALENEKKVIIIKILFKFIHAIRKFLNREF